MNHAIARNVDPVEPIDLQHHFRLQPSTTTTNGLGWLQQFFKVHPPFVIGDDSATTFLSCAALITSAVALACDSTLLLAQATQYPTPFVRAVCRMMNDARLWDDPAVIQLQRLIANRPQDAGRIFSQVQCVGNAFWDTHWSPETEFALEALRQRVVFGGASQHWIDSGALAYFGLLEYQSMDAGAKR